MGHTLLFAGDSVTESQRLAEGNQTELGSGYVEIIDEYFEYKNIDVSIINKGCNGFKVCDLRKRWQEDCIDFNPDVVTILIGVNEILAMMYNNTPANLRQFKEDYEFIIKETLTKTKAKIILVDPFMFNYPDELKTWREYIDREIQSIRILAEQYKVSYIPLDSILAYHTIKFGREELSPDGVHLTKKGHKIVSREWLSEYSDIMNVEL